MKKFLTVLLALSVVFTYTFGTAGSVFAAEQYSLDDYAKVLTAEKAAQLTYLDKAKAQAVGAYTYDKDGFTTDGYMEAAYIAAADKVISDLTTAMDDAINSVLNGTFPTSVPDQRHFRIFLQVIQYMSRLQRLGIPPTYRGLLYTSRCV